MRKILCLARCREEFLKGNADQMWNQGLQMLQAGGQHIRLDYCRLSHRPFHLFDLTNDSGGSGPVGAKGDAPGIRG
jgi:hypothetical protein